MQLIPAIDLLDGRCVRLRRGDFNQVTYYDTTAAELSRAYAASGADWLHIVDLAASRDGTHSDTQALFDVLGVAPQHVQTGGGVRDATDIEKRLNAGAQRVVVGSVCALEPERFLRWTRHFGPERLVAALDVHQDAEGQLWPRVRGWTDSAKIDLMTLLGMLVPGGVRHVLCTDISRDGDMNGPNIALYRQLTRQFPEIQLQASGGVSSLNDLRDLKPTGAAGVITGKALLDGVFDVEQALAVLE